MDDLLRTLLKTSCAERITYSKLFDAHLNINPHAVNLNELMNCALQHHLQIETEIKEIDTWLQLLMSHIIEPLLGQNIPCFVYDFPSSQSALARIQPGSPSVASRFEVYFRGIELANGFHELTDAHEQRRRFENNNTKRMANKLQPVPIDEFFLAALQHGLPDCSGVALGVDRLVMLATHQSSIAEVMSFDIRNA
jgi:lysyl-tRNA synthetase class 2